MNEAFAKSETSDLRLAKGIFETAPDKQVFRQEADALLAWAVDTGPSHRKTLASAYRQSFGTPGNLFMVHQISTLPKTQARAFEGVSAVVDAIVDAGRSIAELASEIGQWTISEVGDPVEALIEAGRSLAQIFAEALVAGVVALAKFVRAAIDIGRTIGDVLVWAVTETVAGAAHGGRCCHQYGGRCGKCTCLGRWHGGCYHGSGSGCACGYRAVRRQCDQSCGDGCGRCTGRHRARISCNWTGRGRSADCCRDAATQHNGRAGKRVHPNRSGYWRNSGFSYERCRRCSGSSGRGHSAGR